MPERAYALKPGRKQADRKSTRLNSSHSSSSYAVFCLKKKTTHPTLPPLALAHESRLAHAARSPSSWSGVRDEVLPLEAAYLWRALNADGTVARRVASQ